MFLATRVAPESIATHNVVAFILESVLMEIKMERYGRLTVISLNSKKQRYRNGKKDGFFYYYNCKCDCGNEVVVSKEHLKSGHTRSCGCLFTEAISTTDGLYKKNKRLYYIWRGILGRCLNKNHPSFKDYGGRGIDVCDDWRRSFKAFYSWAVNNGYESNLSIERIDVDSGYNADNCKWITLPEQALNKRTSLRIEFNGVVKTLKEWCSCYGFKRHMFYFYKKKFNLSNTEALIRCI